MALLPVWALWTSVAHMHLPFISVYVDMCSVLGAPLQQSSPLFASSVGMNAASQPPRGPG